MRLILTLFLIFIFQSITFAQNNCEQITSIALQKLPSLLLKNDFNQAQLVSQTLNASCTSSEFAHRLDIINSLIQKNDTKNLINQYLNKRYDDILIHRFDNAAQKDFKKRYLENKGQFEYIPLRHAVDSLLQVKAVALLQSDRYTFTDQETAILHLFADHIDTYLAYIDKKTTQPSRLEKEIDHQNSKTKHTFGLHAGIYTPLGKNDYFNTSPTFGISVMTPMVHSWIGEFHYKARIDSKAKNILVNDEGSIREINSQSLHNISLGVGHKAFDNDKIVILPKLNIGLGFIWTGISETVYQVDEYGEEYETTNYKNINTMHTNLGISIMRHIGGKKYIGFETNYHYVPYTWHKRLISPIQSQYGSVELFFRF